MKSKVLWCFILKLESRINSAPIPDTARLSPKGCRHKNSASQQMNIESSNTAGMAMRRPREYGDEETKARSKGTKVSKVEPKAPCDQNQLIDEDDRNETKDEHINETDNIALKPQFGDGISNYQRW